MSIPKTWIVSCRANFLRKTCFDLLTTFINLPMHNFMRQFLDYLGTAELRQRRTSNVRPDRSLPHKSPNLCTVLFSTGSSLGAPIIGRMEKTHIKLIILSPSPEVNKLTFSGIATATNIGELKERISAEVASHPAPARQRLIYRGHALVDVGKTLKDIFTQEIVCLILCH